MNYPFSRKNGLFNSKDKKKKIEWEEERLGEREGRWGQINYTQQEPEKCHSIIY